MSKKYPKASKHGEIEEVFDNVFLVRGSAAMGPGMRISRNMTIIREGTSLTLICTIRLNEEGLQKLDALGKVEHVVKLGDYHLDFKNGMDDPFYLDRYQAKYWAMPGMTHNNGVETTHPMTPGGELPFSGASLFSYETSKRPEGLLLLEHEGGILISADSLQNWEADDFFSPIAKLIVRLGGYFRPANVGPAWRKKCQPQASDFARVKALNFRHLIPSHGKPIKNTARKDFTKTFKELYGV